MTETLTGAQIAVRLLERQGIKTLAGIAGPSSRSLFAALAQSRAIRPLFSRPGQDAGRIVQGMARATGTPAACIASPDPGTTALLAHARLDAIPLVAIVGSEARPAADPCLRSLLPLIKLGFAVSTAKDLLTVIPEAFAAAAGGRPGPVLVDIPADIQKQAVHVGDWTETTAPRPLPGADPAHLARAAAMIDAAARPALYLGARVAPAAASLARQLSEKAGLPTAMSLAALGAVPVDHPLSLGMAGEHGARATNLTLEECDLLVAVGTGGEPAGHGAAVIRIGCEPAPGDRPDRHSLDIAGDAPQILAELLSRVHPAERTPWRRRIAELQARFPFPLPDADELLSPFGLIQAVAACLDNDAIIASDPGQPQVWVAQSYPLRRPHQLLTPERVGSGGFAIPAGLGAALAAPGRTVVCFTGGEAILAHTRELATAVEEGLNLKVVVMDDAPRAGVRSDQLGIAQSLGIRGADLARAANPLAALMDCLSSAGPGLLRMAVNGDRKVIPLTPAARRMAGRGQGG